MTKCLVYSHQDNVDHVYGNVGFSEIEKQTEGYSRFRVK